MRRGLPESGGEPELVALASISVVTLGVNNLDASRRFYGDGFGWTPVFTNDEILFFQMNGLMLGLWLAEKLAADMARAPAPPGSISLAHNVADQDSVELLINRLMAHGGTLLRAADAPPQGGYRGYVADTDGHSWEIAHNPAWPIDANVHVTFAA